MILNPLYFWGGLGVIAISGAAWLAHDLKERGRMEAMQDINAQAQKIEIEQANQKIENMRSAFAVADSAMATRAAAYGVVYEKAQKLQNGTADKGPGRSQERGNLGICGDDTDGMLDKRPRDDSNAVRVPAPKNSERIERAEKCSCDGRYGPDIGRNLKNRLIQLAAECDRIAADYNALLDICRH